MKNINITKRIVLVSVFALTLGSCQEEFVSPAGLTGSTIAATMEASADFNLWTAVVKRVGIYGSLNNNNSGVVTIFGPSDPAMTAYLSATFSAQLASLQPVNETSLIAFIDGLSATSNPTLASFVSTLVPVINYHIVSSKITSNLITGTQVFATLNSARLSISKVGTTVLLNGNSSSNGATVTAFDLQGSNGVTHTIDRVMAAPSTANVLTNLGLTVSYATNPPTVGGPSSAGAAGGFELFATLIRYTGQVPTILPNSTPLPDFTIFQVADGAIVTYMMGFDVALNSEAACYTYISTVTSSSSTSPSLAQLTSFIQYHIVPGRYLTTDFTNGQTLTTLSTGKVITVSISPVPPAPGPYTFTLGDLNAAADPVISSGNALSNSGIVHTINTVLRDN